MTDAPVGEPYTKVTLADVFREVRELGEVIRTLAGVPGEIELVKARLVAVESDVRILMQQRDDKSAAKADAREQTNTRAYMSAANAGWLAGGAAVLGLLLSAFIFWLTKGQN